MDVKKGKIFLPKRTGGELIQLDPEISMDSELDSSSENAVENKGVMQGIFDRFDNRIIVVEEGNLPESVEDYPDEAMFAEIEKDVWKFTVNVGSGKKTGVPINLSSYVQGTNLDCEMEIDWGDGTSSCVSASDYTNTDSSASIHEYNASGTYNVSVYCSNWNDIYLISIGTSTALANVSVLNSTRIWRQTLVSIDSPMPRVKGAFYAAEYYNNSSLSFTRSANFQQMFRNCLHLTSVCKDVFIRNSNIVGFNYCFSGCSSLEKLPAGMFTPCAKAKTFTGCFYACTSLKTLPSNLFKTNEVAVFGGNTLSSDYTGLYTNGCFEKCSSLASIPERLFADCPNASNFSGCFRDCSSLASIPERLFANNANATSFIATFKNCTSIYSLPASLFHSCINANEFTACFRGCTSLRSVPEDFFKYCINATAFGNAFTSNNDGCFQGCTKLATIPEGLFEGLDAVTTFESCFYECTSLQTVPASIFNGCSSAVDFSCCFYFCTSLQTVPASIFNGCSSAADFTYCFYYCTAMQEIPAGLFSSCSNASVFTCCFYCTAIQEIPAGLFSSCSNASNFSGCFNGCESLETVPAGLFSSCSNASIFSSCFNNCISIRSIPSDIFSGCIAASTFSFCFAKCSRLSSIPEELFSSCFSVHTVNSCFSECSSITSLPAGLFQNCSAIVEFKNCFSRCTNLQNVPQGLFDGCVNAETFRECFTYCSSLASIPTGLFNNNVNVIDFYRCFFNTALTSYHLRIGSEKVTTVTEFSPQNASVGDVSICVPADSLTYKTFTAYAETANIQISTDLNECIEAFEFTVDTAAAEANSRKASVPFHLAGQNLPSLTVDWGDGTASTLTSADYSIRNSNASVHEYAQAGEYQITVSSTDWNSTPILVYETADAISLSDESAAAYWFRKTLKSIDSPLPKLAGTITHSSDNPNFLVSSPYLNYCFAGCTALESLPHNMFSANSSARTFDSAFRGCSSLLNVPNTIFYGCRDVDSFSQCFEGCSSLQMVPDTIFKKNESASSFSRCFAGCSSIASIGNLFPSGGAAFSLSECFQNCTSLTTVSPYVLSDISSNALIEGFFDGCTALNKFRIAINAEDISSFANFIPDCADADRIMCVPEGSTTYESAAAFANASNGIIVSIDSTFCLGVFQMTVSATSENSYTTGIPFNLKTQPGITLNVDWGDGTESVLTSADYSSNSNASTHTYSTGGTYTVSVYSNNWRNTYIMSYNSNATSASGPASAFYWFRRSLVEVNGIMPPMKGTVTYSTTNAVTTYDNEIRAIFFCCTKLRSISDSFFASLDYVQSFFACFNGCTSLQSIPSNLFARCTSVKNLSRCFIDCNSIQSLNIKIGSRVVETATDFTPYIGSASSRRIEVPADSTTYSTFAAIAYTYNYNIIGV